MSASDRQDVLEALVLYIAHATKRDASFGRTKLAKVLFYSDFDSYRDAGTSLTGATYERWQFGPFPRDLLDLERRLERTGKASLDYDVPEGEEKKIVPGVDPPNLRELIEPWQVTLIDTYIRQFREQTSREVSDESHQHPGWRMAQELEVIPYETAFLPSGPPRTDQVERAKEIARDQGWLTDDGFVWERRST
jgi:hypothetical protein